jgi:hypothetical protein
MDRASRRISRCAAFVAVLRLTSPPADRETSQQRGDRLLAEYRAFRKAGVTPSNGWVTIHGLSKRCRSDHGGGRRALHGICGGLGRHPHFSKGIGIRPRFGGAFPFRLKSPCATCS